MCPNMSSSSVSPPFTPTYLACLCDCAFFLNRRITYGRGPNFNTVPAHISEVHKYIRPCSGHRRLFFYRSSAQPHNSIGSHDVQGLVLPDHTRRCGVDMGPNMSSECVSPRFTPTGDVTWSGKGQQDATEFFTAICMLADIPKRNDPAFAFRLYSREQAHTQFM